MDRLSGGRHHIYKQDHHIIRPSSTWSVHVHCFLKYLHVHHMNNVPYPVNLGNHTETLTFVDGIVYHYPLPDFFFNDEMINSSAFMLKKLHQLGTQYISTLTGHERWMLEVTSPIETMCHGDFAPYNVTVHDNKVAGIIDFDTLHPGSRLEDLSYAVYRFVPLSHQSTLTEKHIIERIHLFLSIYGATSQETEQLFTAMQDRLHQLMRYMILHAELGEENFIANIQEGHLEIYQLDIEFIKQIEQKFMK